MLPRSILSLAVFCIPVLAAGDTTMLQDYPSSGPVSLLASVKAANAAGNDYEASRLAARLRDEVRKTGTPLTAGNKAVFLVFADGDTTSVRVMGAFDEQKGDVKVALHRVGRLGLWTADYSNLFQVLK